MLKPNPMVLFQTLGDEAVLLHLETEEYFGLDTVGSRVWEVITEKGTIGDVVETLIHEFEVDKATLQSDVEELVERLEAENLLSND